MANTRKLKVKSEIEKAKEKLAEQQLRIRELEAKHTELENTEIVDIVRGLNIPLDNLADVLQAVKGGATLAPDAASGRLGPKAKKNAVKSDAEVEHDTDKEEETE